MVKSAKLKTTSAKGKLASNGVARLKAQLDAMRAAQAFVECSPQGRFTDANAVFLEATGSKLVDSAGKTMEEIVASVKRVTDIMAEISAASQEQTGGLVVMVADFTLAEGQQSMA